MKKLKRMVIFRVILIASVVLFLCSCKRHKEIVFKHAVGDVVYLKPDSLKLVILKPMYVPEFDTVPYYLTRLYGRNEDGQLVHDCDLY